jgi:hypothetical protein
MKKIEKLLEEADTLYGQAEAVVEKSRETARRLFLQGIVLVFKAFLNVNGVEGTGELIGLLNECKQLEADFEAIEAEVEFLWEADPESLDPEDLSDCANEIWDFVIDFISADACD